MARKSVLIKLPSPADIAKNTQIKLEGDWVKAIEIWDKLGPSVLSGYYSGSGKFSRAVLKIVKRVIRDGNPPPGAYWEPLSPNTLKRWGEHDIYYLTGLYYRSVGFFRYKNKTIVGLPLNSRARSSSGGVALSVLARILEYGTGGIGGGKSNGTIPPRPLWNPAFKAAGGLEKLNKEIIRAIRQSLYNGFKIRPNQIKW